MAGSAKPNIVGLKPEIIPSVDFIYAGNNIGSKSYLFDSDLTSICDFFYFNSSQYQGIQISVSRPFNIWRCPSPNYLESNHQSGLLSIYID